MSDVMINWKVFEYKFADNPNEAFESLAYYLFCYEFKQDYGIFRYFNQAGIETNPIESNGNVIGFQAKYYEPSTKISEKKKDFIDCIDIAKAKYSHLTKIVFYTNKEFSQSSNKCENEPKYLKEIMNHAKKNGIDIEWRVRSNFEKILLNKELEQIYNIFFNPYFEKNPKISTIQKTNDKLKNEQEIKYICLDKAQDFEILDRSIKQVLTKAKKDIDIGNCEEVNETLRYYMMTNGFDELKQEVKLDIIYYRAICLLNLEKYDEAKIVAEQILKIKKNSLRYYEIYVSWSILICNREEYNKNIKKLKEFNEEEKRIIKYELKMLYSEKKYQKIISNYINDNNIINKKLSDDDECIGIIIASLLTEARTDIAINILDNIEIKSEYLKFLKAVVNLYYILNNRENLLELTEDTSMILNKNIKLLESVKEYFNNNMFYKKSYYYYLLNALLFQDCQKCITEYENLEDAIKQDKEIKTIYIDALCMSSNVDLAEETIYEILDYNCDNVLIGRLAEILCEKKEYLKIIDLLKNKELKKNKDNGFLAQMYVKALLNTENFEKVEELVNNDYKEFALVNISIAEFLFIKSGDNQKIEEYCNRSVNSISKENEFILGYIATICEKINFVDKSIEILEKCKMNFRKTKKLYIRNVIKYKKSSEKSIKNALELVNELLRKGEDYVLTIYKGELLKKINRNLEAFECFDKAFIINSNPVAAYYCLSLKIELENYSAVDKYISILDTSEEIEHQLMVAFICSKINRFDMSNKAVYKIAFKMRNNIDKDVIAKIIFNIYMVNYKEYDWGKYEKIQENVIFQLEDEEKNIRKICIETDICIDKEPIMFFDIELFSYKSLVKNKVILKKINDNVIIDNKQYKIKRLISKYEYVFIRLRDMFFKNLPEKNQYCTLIKTDINNPIAGIMPYLEERRNYTQNIIDKYRMKEDNVGLTINLLAKQIGSTEINIIHSLLYDSKEIYYAGEISDISNEEYVISLTSLIMSKIFEIDKKLIEIKDRIHIAESTVIKLNTYFYSKINDDVSASIGIENDDKPYMIEKTDKAKETELEFIRELIELVSNFKIEKNNFSDDYLNIYSILSEDEQDSICIAKNNNYTLIADDLCLRKIYNVLSNNYGQSNIIEFIKYFNMKQRVNILEQISKTQYLYCINKDIMIELILFHEDNDKEKISNIIKNLLETREKYQFYRKIIGQALVELSKVDITLKQSKKLFEVIKLVLKIDNGYKEN